MFFAPGGSARLEATVTPSVTRSSLDSTWEEMVAAEELIHALVPALAALAKSIEHGSLPDDSTRSLFDGQVEVRDLRVASKPDSLGTRGVRRYRLRPVARRARVAGSSLALWSPLFARLKSPEHVGFRVTRGRFEDAQRSIFVANLQFDGAATNRDGRAVSVHGAVATRWRKHPSKEASAAEWRIESWDSESLDVIESPRRLFSEALDRVVADESQLLRLRRSRHEEMALAKIRDPASFQNPHRHFFLGSQDRHPGVAVTDVNGDGIDDIYVMARWGANQLLVGRADGTFSEEAAQRGLAIEDHSAAAIFADFDNDGDADLFLGRTMVPSMYLENQSGRFVDRSNRFSAGALPSLVSSVNAVDVDNDGLLDIYVSTYAAQMLVFDLKLVQARNPGTVAPPQLLADFLPTSSAAELSRRVRTKGAHLYLSLPGPPNVLLLNQGGSFRLSRDGELGSYRNTYQATWSDYDRDGDADVYLAHDFAPNQLLRNDGSGNFEDVTEPTGTADIGFGMGVTWGDYDRDGFQDLYVSNMYSKAGNRVTSYFDDVDRRFVKMARGNTLFRNRAGRSFERVSGVSAPSLLVEKAGWSWGGQFADFDNDSHLDLYVASGYYTAPRDVAVAVDT